MNSNNLLILLSPEGEAAARDVLETCTLLRDRFSITVLARRERREAFAAVGVGFEPWRPSGIFGMGASIATLRKAATRLAPAIVHAHGFPAAAVALGTFPTSLASRTIVTFDDSLREGELPQKMIERKLPKFLRRAARLVATYPTLARNLEKRFTLDAGSVQIVPHGVAVPLDGAPLARPVGRPGPILGWRGLLNADRAWEVAVDALAKTRESFPDARLHVEGTGRARQFVNAYVRTNGLAPYVNFRGVESASDLFATIDVLLVPISRDAQPHAPLEALVAGVPVIAANVGALADALGPFEIGWLVDDEAATFAAGVTDAWSQIDAAWDGAARQRHIARDRYGRDGVTAAQLALYEAVMRSGAT